METSLSGCVCVCVYVCERTHIVTALSQGEGDVVPSKIWQESTVNRLLSLMHGIALPSGTFYATFIHRPFVHPCIYACMHSSIH